MSVEQRNEYSSLGMQKQTYHLTRVQEDSGSTSHVIHDFVRGPEQRLLRAQLSAARPFHSAATNAATNTSAESAVPSDLDPVGCVLTRGFATQNSKGSKSGSLAGGSASGPAPELFTKAMAGENKMVASFGGQGFDWLAQLRLTWNSTKNQEATEFTRFFIRECVAASAEIVERNPKIFPKGYDVESWIEAPRSKGDPKSPNPADDWEYMTTSQISLPMIYVTQMAAYVLMAKTLELETGLTVEQLRSSWSSGLGHSQGIIGACVISASSNHEDILKHSKTVVQTMQEMGIVFINKMKKLYPPPEIFEICREKHWGPPHAMMSILGWTAPQIQALIEEMKATDRLALALYNQTKSIVVSGYPEAIVKLRLAILDKEEKSKEAAKGMPTARIPFSKRVPPARMQFLPIPVPFHSPFGQSILIETLATLRNMEVQVDIKKEDLNFPVWNHGSLNLCESDDIHRDILTAVLTEPVRWDLIGTKLIEDNVTHIVDFGPRSGALLGPMINGAGIQIVDSTGVTDKESKKSSVTRQNIVGMGALYAPSLADWPTPRNFKTEYAPTVVPTGTGTFRVQTRWTKAFRKPPFLVAGMTPTTADVGLVAAASRAGYYAELAGGGQPTPAHFRRAIVELTEKAGPGATIHPNLLFLNHYLWGFQFPLCIQMKKEGYLIESITVAAGLPTPEKCKEIIDQMLEVGIKKIAFKPASAQAMKDIMVIARENPDMTIIVQWTGGLAGGHHSMEDAHEPLLEVYQQLRELDNIIIVFGGGMGDPNDAAAYLDGSWSTKLGPYPVMPIDAILIGSRMMTAKEALTSTGARALLMAARKGGVEKKNQWEKTLESPQWPDNGKLVSGVKEGELSVITIRSELEEPMHVLKTRGALVWLEMDKRFFSITDANKRQVAIEAQREWIVNTLNNHFQKPYFGWCYKTNKPVHRFQQMTYLDICRRLLDLQHLAKTPGGKREWVDPTYTQRYQMWLQRTTERFLPSPQPAPKFLSYKFLMEDPEKGLEQLREMFPASAVTVVHPEDVWYFIELCKMPLKPMNFVPSLDAANFKFWLKKDSLWYSEDPRTIPVPAYMSGVEADVERADRTIILQGPVAVQFHTAEAEPVGQILEQLNGSVGAIMLARGKCAEEPKTQEKSTALPSSLSDLDEIGWLKPILHSHMIAANGKWTPNPLKRIFSPPQAGAMPLNLKSETIKEGGEKFLVVSLNEEGTSHVSVKAKQEPTGTEDDVKITFYHLGAPLYQHYSIIKSDSDMAGADGKVLLASKKNFSETTNFYKTLWIDMAPKSQPNIEEWKAYLQAIAQDGYKAPFFGQTSLATSVTPDAYLGQLENKLPMDAGFIFAWDQFAKTTVQATQEPFAPCNLLALVHLSNDLVEPYKFFDQSGTSHKILLSPTQNIKAVGILRGVYDEPNGRVFKTKIKLTEDSEPLLNIYARCFIPNHAVQKVPGKFEPLFNTVEGVWDVKTNEDDQYLWAKQPWIRTSGGGKVELGRRLQLEIYSKIELKEDYTWLVTTSGKVHQLEGSTAEVMQVTKVDPSPNNMIPKPEDVCPVWKFVELAASMGHAQSFKVTNVQGNRDESTAVYNSGGWLTPPSNVKYAMASRDTNPLHTNPSMCQLAGFSDPIVHGMFMSAQLRRSVMAAIFSLDGKQAFMTRFNVSFEAPVSNGEVVETLVFSRGVHHGDRLWNAVIRSKQSQQVLLSCTATSSGMPVQHSAFLFTGQGSAFKGMGSDLFASQEQTVATVAGKEVWERVDEHFVNIWGFSLLQIVKENPSRVWISFRTPGSDNGAKWKARWAALQTSRVDEQGNVTYKPLFPQLQHGECNHLSWETPQGALYQTQFQQPAIVTLEMASWASLINQGVARGAVPRGTFAGHSAGEFGALSAMLPEIPPEAMAELVMLRGLFMQSTVERDAKGKSKYGMSAVMMERLKDIDEAKLKDIVTKIREKHNGLLDVVNYNSRGFQYVVAGEKALLDEMDHELAAYRAVEKGRHCVSLPGIDVPFHSKLFGNAVPIFKQTMLKMLDLNHVQVDFSHLDGTRQALWIPNVTGEPLPPDPLENKEWLQGLANQTGSKLFKEIAEGKAKAKPNEVLCELMSFQLANPVQWIKTQDAFTSNDSWRRAAEIGPKPVLTAMLQQLIKPQGQKEGTAKDERLALHWPTNADYIKYGEGTVPVHPEPVLMTFANTKAEEEPRAPAAAAAEGQAGQVNVNLNGSFVADNTPAAPPKAQASAAAAEAESKPAATAAPQAAAPAAAPPPPPPPTSVTQAPVIQAEPVAAPPTPAAGGGTIYPALKVTTKHRLSVLLAKKLDMSLDKLAKNATIRELTGGRSALQNELMALLETEFGCKAEGMEDKNIDDAAQSIEKLLKSQPEANGKVLTGFISRWASQNLPVGYALSDAQFFLKKTFSLSDTGVAAVCIHAIVRPPEKKLSNKGEAEEWLASLVAETANFTGVAPAAVAGGGGGGGGVRHRRARPARGGGGGGGPTKKVDMPVTVFQTLQVILAKKAQLPVETVTPKETLRGLAGGRSALQNEILADLDAEFKVKLEGVEDLNLGEAAAKIEQGLKLTPGEHHEPGKVLNAMISKTISGFPPGLGKSDVEYFLATNFNLTEMGAKAVLAQAVAVKPPGGGADAVKAWLGQIATSVSGVRGISLTPASGGSAVEEVQEDFDDYGEVTLDASVVLDPLRTLMTQQKKLLDQFLGTIDAEANSEAAQEEAKKAKEVAERLQESQLILDAVAEEHTPTYWKGIKPVFDTHPGRKYDSWYHLGRHDLRTLLIDLDEAALQADSKFERAQRAGFYPATEAEAKKFTLPQLYTKIQTLGGDHKEVRDFAELLYRIANRATDTAVTMVQAQLDGLDPICSAAALKRRIWLLSLRSLLASTANQKAIDLTNYLPQKPTMAGSEARFKDGESIGIARYVETYLVKPLQDPNSKIYVALAHDPGVMERGEVLDTAFYEGATTMAKHGVTFHGKKVLITGAGPGSIGSRIAGHFLRGGASVAICINILRQQEYQFFQDLYETHAGKGATLEIVLYNAASRKDQDSLIDHLWKKDGGLGWGAPDFIFPMAAIPENGRTMDRIDDISEIAFRAMLTNVNILVGKIGRKIENEYKESGKHLGASVSTCVLPLSPNHGIFGSDGLYASSKISLRTIYRKWLSERWYGSLSIIGSEIGWTRSTGLMAATDLLAPRMEAQGVHTFSPDDTAFWLVALCQPKVVDIARNEAPIHANLTAGLHQFSGQSSFSARLFEDLRKNTVSPFVATVEAVQSQKKEEQPKTLYPRANPSSLPIPRLPEKRPAAPKGIDLRSVPLHKLKGMLDLSQIVVCVGYGEVGPYGSARSRWDFECHRKLSMESAIELARALGLINYAEGSGADSVGAWVDAKTKQIVPDHLMWETYEKEFRARCGIRKIDPNMNNDQLKWKFEGYDGSWQESLKQVALSEDLSPFEVSDEDEISFLKRKHGKNIVVEKVGKKNMVILKKGAQVYLPQRKPFNREVAGLMPTGWTPRAYGLPDDVCKAIDPICVYSLCATMDAFTMAGISDPYELYRYMHMSEVGNCMSSCAGGMTSITQVMRESFLDKPDINADVLQEIFVSTPSAWQNLLFLSTCGPIKPISATCATAAVAFDTAVDTIRARKAKFIVVGGAEDFNEDMSREFMNMKATSASDVEFAQGFPPEDHCRPNSSTRGGFMEAHGCGVQLFCNAEVALEMGLPIYAIIGGSNTAMDGVGRSVPAPGKGLVSVAREIRVQEHEGSTKAATSTRLPLSPLLDVNYRREQFDLDRKYSPDMGSTQEHFSHFTQVQQMRLRGDQRVWGHDFCLNDPSISPLRGALAVWGLTPDNIDLVSCHGTGTTANDVNEANVINTIMEHLGRTPGLPVFTVSQKWITGHPKGAAAAWMFNGVVQAMSSGLIPGTKSTENISNVFNSVEHVLMTNKNIQMNRPLHAALINSFGFGQAGGQTLVLNSDLLYGAMGDEEYEDYRRKQSDRSAEAQHFYASTIYPALVAGKQAIRPRLPVKSLPPYPTEERINVFLDPTSRAPMSQPLHLGEQEKPPTWAAHLMRQRLKDAASGTSSALFKLGLGFGIDTANLKEFESVSVEFIQRNFTPQEVDRTLAGPRSKTDSLAGLWCAKEAVFKCICSALASSSTKDMPAILKRGPGAPLIDVEIVRVKLADKVEVPEVKFSPQLATALDKYGILGKNIKLSISYSNSHAFAEAVHFGQPV
eukprot:g23924.t1